MCVCVCVCVCVHACACVRVCVCACVRVQDMQSSLMMFFPNLLLEGRCQSSSSVSTCLAKPTMLVVEREAAGECGGRKEGRWKQQGVLWGERERSAGLLKMVYFSDGSNTFEQC